MNGQKIIELARKAGFAHGIGCFAAVEEDIVAFAKLVAEHEREACAKVCEDHFSRSGILAETIRARGQK